MDDLRQLDIDLTTQEYALLQALLNNDIALAEDVPVPGVTRNDLAESVVRYVLSPEYVNDADAVLTRLNVTTEELALAAARMRATGTLVGVDQKLQARLGHLCDRLPIQTVALPSLWQTLFDLLRRPRFAWSTALLVMIATGLLAWQSYSMRYEERQAAMARLAEAEAALAKAKAQVFSGVKKHNRVDEWLKSEHPKGDTHWKTHEETQQALAKVLAELKSLNDNMAAAKRERDDAQLALARMNEELRKLRPPAVDPVAVAAPVPPAFVPNPLALQARELLSKHCTACHGDGERPKAKLKVLAHADLIKRKLIVPGKPEQSDLIQRVSLPADDESRMPPPGKPPLSKDDVKVLRDWVIAGAPDLLVPGPSDNAFVNASPVNPAIVPSYPVPVKVPVALAPEFLDSEHVHQQILADVRMLGAEAHKYRYFSFNHLAAEGLSREDLKTHEQALALAINYLSWQPKLEKPVAIDANNSIFRVNVQTLGWLERPFTNVAGGKADTLTLFDLVLLEYPYGVIPDVRDVRYAELASAFLVPAKQVRPIAFVRGDWFVSVALNSPLYDDLLQLPRKLADLEKLLGIDAEKNISEFTARRAGVTVSGVARHNRIIERHPSQSGYYWKTYDFAGNFGSSNVIAHPLTHKGDVSEAIFRLPNGLQAFFLADGQGNRVSSAPTTVLVDAKAADKVVRNALSCIRCHTDGIRGFEDVIKTIVAEVKGTLSKAEREQIQNLYESKSLMDGFIRHDRESFLAAERNLLGAAAYMPDIIEQVTRRYLDKGIDRRTASAELGLPDMEHPPDLPGSSAASDPLNLANGPLRRDAWDDLFPRMVVAMRRGIPLLPLDALSRPACELAEKHALEVTINRPTSGKAELLIANKGPVALFIDVAVFGADGRITRLDPDVRELPAGGTYRFPPAPQEFITVEPDEATDQVVVYSGTKRFAPGKALRFAQPLRDGTSMNDRFVHEGYTLRAGPANQSVRVEDNLSDLQKKSVEFRTR